MERFFEIFSIKYHIKDIDNAYLVKDNIEYGYINEIPLWSFGLLY